MLSKEGHRQGFEPLMRLDMDIGLFASNWVHCDRASSYMARMVSHDRADPIRYGNLFSSALNELLETVFRVHGSDGALSCAIYRLQGRDRIELTIPADERVLAFYLRVVGDLEADAAPERYREALFAPGEIEPAIGLLELAVDYRAGIRIEDPADGTLRLIADLDLEREGQ